MSDGNNRKRKLQLMKRDPRCFFCNVETIDFTTNPGPGSKVVPDNAASLYHLRPRTDPDRLVPYYKDTETRIVLACVKCNNERHNSEHLAISKEVRRGLTLLRDRSQTTEIMRKTPSQVIMANSAA